MQKGLKDLQMLKVRCVALLQHPSRGEVIYPAWLYRFVADARGVCSPHLVGYSARQ